MENLNLIRLFKLIKIDIVTNKKSIFVTAALFAVVLALFPFHVTGSLSAYSLLLYIGGFMVTSNAFSEMHSTQKAFQYLTLPCSNLERFLSKWLLTTIIYALALLIIFYLLSELSFFANAIFFHNMVSVFVLSHFVLWVDIGKYIILQSLFLLGAAYFKKSSITKTALLIGCFLIFLAMLLFLFSWVVCPGCTHIALFDLVSQSLNGLSFIFWVVMAPFCWWMTYVRISECEIL